MAASGSPTEGLSAGTSALKKRTKSAPAPKKVPDLVLPEKFKDRSRPKQLDRNRSINGVLHLAGVGNKDSDIMFLSPCPFEEEASTRVTSYPRLLNGAPGALFRRMLFQGGMDPESVYYTTLCKYDIGKGKNLKPKKEDINWCLPMFEAELKEVSPKLVVCLGKPAFDHMVDFACTQKEVQGGFFHSNRYDVPVYCMDNLLTPLYKPEFIPRFDLDLHQVSGFMAGLSGRVEDEIPLEYNAIDNVDDLNRWVMDRLLDGTKLLSVDCEWGSGTGYMDIKLRSLQCAWAPGKAVYLKFYDENVEWAMKGASGFEELKPILSPLMNQPDMKFCGHNVTVDFVVMSHWLGINTYKKCYFDTMYAEFLIDEYADQKLERLSLKYTSLGRYDTELFLYKKKKKIPQGEGYSRIPDKIIIPYACLRWDAKVQLADDSWAPIGKLVEDRYAGEVRCTIDGIHTTRKVTAWHVSEPVQHEWYKLVTGMILEDSRWGPRGPALTPDHKVLTQRGKVRVDDLIPGQDSIISYVSGGMAFTVEDPILKVVPARDKKGSKYNCRYCLTVEEAGNFMTEVGFVSNCKDVDVVLRAIPAQQAKLEEDGLNQYYYDINLPYVTDVFTSMTTTGLPIGIEELDELRDTFVGNREILTMEFRSKLKYEANLQLFQVLMSVDPTRAATVLGELYALDKARFDLDSTIVEHQLDLENAPWHGKADDDHMVIMYSEAGHAATNAASVQAYSEAFSIFKEQFDPETFSKVLPVFNHWWEAHMFNTNSDAHKKRWLFDVLKLTPVKTTKKDGVQMPWEKVLEMTEDRQSEFSPSTDKETMNILSGKHPLVAQMLELTSVSTIVKTFINIPDEKTGEERGIHKWVCSSGRLHCNFATTETGRPRTWHPNVLNYPKSITRPIEAAFKRLGQDKPFSVRSCAKAPPGHVFVDADLETAEVVSLAYISGDQEMIDVCTKTDKNFVAVDPSFLDQDRGEKYLLGHEIPVCNFKGSYNVRQKYLDRDELNRMVLRDVNGDLVHPRRDVHWEMAETMMLTDREFLNEGIDRTSGKVGVFSIPYGTSPSTLDRMIESIIGRAVPGTGEKLIETYNTKFQVASHFLQEQANLPEGDGFYRSLSGRLRRFHVHEQLDGLSDWARKSIVSPLTREARNYPMQEIVAASMARCAVWLLEEFISRGMTARPMILLHDAITVLCPVEERWEVVNLLQECMSRRNTWNVNGRTLQYEIDYNFCTRWGLKLQPHEKWLEKSA